MRKITDFSEVPQKYYLRLMKTRGVFYQKDFEHTKPATPEEIEINTTTAYYCY